MAPKNTIDVNWEDDDSDFEEEFGDRKSADEEKEFVELLTKEGRTHAFTAPQVGDKVEATVSFIGETAGDVMLDLGGKASGVMSKQELCNEEGQLRIKIGDRVAAFVVSTAGGELVLSNSLSHGVAKQHALETAFDSGMPVRGKVMAVNKGGFEVSVMGKKAFCPVSQIDLRYVENPPDYMGKEFDFLIQKMTVRDIVLSRAALLREKASETLGELKAKLDDKPIVDGTVVELKDFGAMVDIGGGLIGMVHISELGHGHPRHPKDIVQLGERVRVQVLSVDESGASKNPRIALSMKSLAADPWQEAALQFRVGESYEGKVVRLSEFGAFVELAAGVDGLVHVSELAWGKRIRHPKEILAVGDRVSVRVLDCDLATKRLALSMKALESDPWYQVSERFPVGGVHAAKVESLRPFGALVELAPGLSGLLPLGILKQAFGESYRKKASPGETIEVKVINVEASERRILLGVNGLAAADEDWQDFREYAARQAQTEKARQERAGLQQGAFGLAFERSLAKKKPGKETP